LKEEAVKQRYIQNFLMVSAAFFAMNAPVRVSTPAGSESLMTGAPRVAQVRVEQISNDRAAEKKEPEILTLNKKGRRSLRSPAFF
jgi:hypothetical protein